MKYVTCITIALLCLCSLPQKGMAQDAALDSMELKLQEKGLAAKEKLALYDELSWSYLDKSFEKSSAFARKGMELAEKENNLAMRATLTRNLGVAYYMDNRLDSAEIILMEAMQVVKEGHEPYLEAAVYTALGNLYNVQSRYELAISHYNQALPIFEKLGRTERIYVISSNIGTLYNNRGNYTQAEKYLLMARKAATEAGDIVAQGRIAQNLSNVYFATSKPAEAYREAEEAVRLCREAGSEYDVVMSLTSLSAACHTHLKDNALAMKYAVEALAKARSIDMPNLVSAALRNIAHVYYRSGEYQQAIASVRECLALTDSTDLSQLVTMNSTLMESYIHLGKKAEAEEAYHTLYELMVRQSDEQVTQALAEMEVKYETKKKEEAIASLHSEKRLLMTVTVSLTVAVLLLIVALVLYNRYQRQKRLRAEEQMRAFETHKQLLAAEWLLGGENRERARISRELHDGLGGVLTMAKLKLSQADVSDSLVTLVDNAITEMRRISSNLMPEMLGRFGLRPTLSEYCNSAPVVDLHFYGDDLRYDPSVEMNLYRMACELINNALKHSEATQINVQIITEKERVSLIVQDNGKGFDTANIPGNGLNSIKNRASLMGATLDIFSDPANGTEITVEIKMKAS